MIVDKKKKIACFIIQLKAKIRASKRPGIKAPLVSCEVYLKDYFLLALKQKK